MTKTNKKQIYLDYMASTPVDPRVAGKMIEAINLETLNYANPSSSHAYAQKVQTLIVKAKQQIADTIHAEPKEVIFTGGATEANNLALFGVAEQYHKSGKHIITMACEHKAILDPCKHLEKQGFEVTYLKPTANGLVNLNDLEQAIRPDTILISIMWVNNETGMIQPIKEITEIAKKHGVLMHSDAAQAIGKVKVNLQEVPVDLVSLAAHKIYGPKGIGALYVRSKPRVRLKPQMFGGGQQFSLRPGTLPTHQIIGMGEAFAVANQLFAEENKRIALLRNSLWNALQALGSVYLNGDLDCRVAGNLNVAFKGVNGEALLCALRNLMVSTGSACNAADVEPSHVLTSMGIKKQLAQNSIRFSIGRMTTQIEIDNAIEMITDVVNRLRALNPDYQEKKA